MSKSCIFASAGKWAEKVPSEPCLTRRWRSLVLCMPAKWTHHTDQSYNGRQRLCVRKSDRQEVIVFGPRLAKTTLGGHDGETSGRSLGLDMSRPS